MRRFKVSWRISIQTAALFLVFLAVTTLGSCVHADCPEEPPLQNYTGGGTVVCPCFVAGEEAGAVLIAPSEHYPIEILRVGIGWGSAYGGTPQSLEAAIHIYDAGLPNPGTPIFTIEGPVLEDGFINVFDFEPLPGEIVVNSGPFTVTLEFLNENAGNPYAPSMVHDGNGCQTGKNVVFAIPGGWFDACLLGVTGDWVVYAVYRQVNCESGVGEEFTAVGEAGLMSPQPNPFSHETRVEFVLPAAERVDLSVYDVRGEKVATIVDGRLGPGHHVEAWRAKADNGSPLASGVYFVRLAAGSYISTRRLVLAR
jgi:hypothetical protein